MTNAAVVESYRAARWEQDRRFEDWARGGLSASDTDAPEYAEYFGLGEYSGGGVERRVTFRDWLVANAVPPEWRDDVPVPEPVAPPEPVPFHISPGAAFWLPGEVLRELVAGGDAVAAAEVERRRVKRQQKRAARLAANAEQATSRRLRAVV